MDIYAQNFEAVRQRLASLTEVSNRQAKLLRDLSEQFVAVVQRVQQMEQMQQHFVAAAAHHGPSEPTPE